MAQLLKLQDYPSRYELDTYHYPAQFIGLKRAQWKRLKAAWESGTLQLLKDVEYENAYLIEEEKGIFQRVIQRFKKKIEIEEIEIDYAILEETELSNLFKEMDEIDSIDALKAYFLEQIFQFQVRWASSRFGLSDEERRKLYSEDSLRYFIQHFSDNMLLFYKPILYIGEAPVELEMILITPLEAWCISCLDEDYNAVYVGSKHNFWDVKGIPVERRILNPTLAVNRMEKILKQSFSHSEIEMPIKKIVIARNGYIDYANAPMDTIFADKRNVDKWVTELRNTTLPIKHTQLKAAATLLKMCELQGKQSDLAMDDEEITTR